MVLYVSENEMIERFSEGCKESASRCRELNKVEETERPEIFVKLVSALKVAAGSAHQIAQSRLQPEWLKFRDALEAFTVHCQENVFKKSEGPVWEFIAVQLDGIADGGRRLSIARPKSWEDTLDELAAREQRAKDEINGSN